MIYTENYFQLWRIIADNKEEESEEMLAPGSGSPRRCLCDTKEGNTLKRGGGNGATLAHCLFTFGTSYDICCAYYSSFSHRGNTTFNEEMFAHSLYCSYYKERENVYCKIISEWLFIVGNEHWKSKIYSSQGMYREVRHSKNHVHVTLQLNDKDVELHLLHSIILAIILEMPFF